MGCCPGGVPAAIGGPCRPPGLRSPAGWVGGRLPGHPATGVGAPAPIEDVPPKGWGAPQGLRYPPGGGEPHACAPLPSDITEEDLEEAGVLDPGHKRVLLESLQLRK